MKAENCCTFTTTTHLLCVQVHFDLIFTYCNCCCNKKCSAFWRFATLLICCYYIYCCNFAIKRVLMTFSLRNESIFWKVIKTFYRSLFRAARELHILLVVVEWWLSSVGGIVLIQLIQLSPLVICVRSLFAKKQVYN